jgi:hypothetical protein
VVSEPGPWLDLAPSLEVVEVADAAGQLAPRRKIAAAATLAGVYAGFATWTYFAWYYKHQKQSPELCARKRGGYRWGLCWGGDRWFEVDTYAGGADKLGHAWATMALARGGTELLHQWGGFGKLTSSLVSCGLAQLLFFGIELKDAAYYEFSYGDFAFNTAGVLFAFAASNWPAFDALLDFRVQYYPSRDYRRQVEAKGDINIAEDYTGQTYLLALHLGGLPRLRDRTWARFVDVAIGFEARGYKPEQIPVDTSHPVSQRLFFGLTLNAQGLFDHLLRGRSEPARKLTHGMFEVFNVPYSTLPLLDGQRGSLTSDSGGA